MSDDKKLEDSEFSEKNILRITDELVRQVDKTKKMIVIMILVVVVAIPVLWHIAPVISSSFSRPFVLVGYGTVAIAAVFLALGVRQWMILSKWTGRYKMYKELQRKVDEKLDFNGKELQ